MVTGMAILIALAGYYFKRLDNRVDKDSEKITEIHLQLMSMRDELKTEMLIECDIRRDKCRWGFSGHEKNLEKVSIRLCDKICRLEGIRKDDWNAQKQWNKEAERKINSFYYARRFDDGSDGD